MFGQRTGAGVEKGPASHVGQSATSTECPALVLWVLRNSLRLVNDINRMACLKCGSKFWDYPNQLKSFTEEIVWIREDYPSSVRMENIVQSPQISTHGPIALLGCSIGYVCAFITLFWGNIVWDRRVESSFFFSLFLCLSSPLFHKVSHIICGFTLMM